MQLLAGDGADRHGEAFAHLQWLHAPVADTGGGHVVMVHVHADQCIGLEDPGHHPAAEPPDLLVTGDGEQHAYLLRAA